MTALIVNPGLTPSFRGRPTPYLEAIASLLDPHQACTFPVENLGMMHLQAQADALGLPVFVVDGVLDRDPTASHTMAKMQDIAAAHGAPCLIGFSLMEAYASMHDLIARCRVEWPSAFVCLGGLFATLNHQRILGPDGWDVDGVCVGDGERVFAELALRLEEGRSPAGIAGLALRGGAELTMRAEPAGSSPEMRPPWASRAQLPAALAGGFAAALSTQRGCPYRCSFCLTGTTGALLGRSSYRQRDVADVVDEMEHLVQSYGVEYVTIVDDLFVSSAESSRARATRFADEIHRRRLHVRFMCDVRTDSFDETLFRHLHSAGLRRVFVGIESGSSSQLKVYRKGHSADSTATLQRMLDIGIDIVPGTIMWHPTITKEEIEATLGILDHLPYKAAFYLTSRAIPYSGTPLHAQYKALGLLEHEFPIGTWRFDDARMDAVFQKTMQALTLPGAGYESVRRTLLEQLQALESSTVVQATPARTHLLHD